jgi:hypothetical protein
VTVVVAKVGINQIVRYQIVGDERTEAVDGHLQKVRNRSTDGGRPDSHASGE